jgi:hypothetical protein
MMSQTFLTDSELEDFTGYRRPTKQAEWLKARRIRHYVNGAGRVVVARAWLELGDAAKVVTMPQRPNLAAVGGKE